LRQNDEIIPEDKRVRDLLTGIKDQFLNAAKQIIMAFPDLRGDFAATDSHLAATIQMNAALTPDNQNISGVNSGRGEGWKPEFSWWQNITMATTTNNNKQSQRADVENAGSSMTRKCLMAISMSCKMQNRHTGVGSGVSVSQVVTGQKT